MPGNEFTEYELPDGTIAELPSNMPIEEVNQALSAQFPQFFPDSEREGQSSFGKFIDRQKEDLKKIAGGGEAALHGAKRFGAGVGQLISPAIDVLYPSLEASTGRSSGEHLKDYMQGQEESFQGKYGGSLPHEAAAFATEVVPAFMGGAGIKAAQAPQALMNLVKGAPALARGATAAGGIFGKNAALAGAYAPISYDQSFDKTGLAGGLEKAAEAAPIGGTVGAGLAGLTRIPGLPSKALSIFGDKKAAQDAIPDLRGLESGLGSAINSPTLKEFEEKIFDKIPLSGMKSSIYRTGKKLEDEGISILDGLSPDYIKDGVKSNVGAKIMDTLGSYKNQVSEMKNAKYLDVDALADASGVNVTPKNLLKVSNDIKSSLAKSSREWGNSPKSEQNILSSWIDSFRDISGGRVANANFKKGELGDAIENASGKFVKGQLIKMRNALKKDIDDGMSGDVPKKVKDAYKDAEKYYSDTYAPLIADKDLSRYLKNGSDPDTLVNYFLKTGGKDDRSTLFEKLSSRIPAEDRKLIAREYFDRSFQKKGKEGLDQFSPKKMVSLYNSLPERTRELLLPEKSFKKEMQKYITRVDKNPSSSEALFNEKTGAVAPFVYAATAVGGALASGNPAVIAGMLGTLGGSALARKYLRSPKTREQYLKALQPMAQPGGMAGGVAGSGAIGASFPQ